MSLKKPIYMYLAEVKKTSGKFDTTHKVALYPDNTDEPPKWFSDFANVVFTRLDKIESRLDKIESRLDKLETRIDNLVVKNNLKE